MIDQVDAAVFLNNDNRAYYSKINTSFGAVVLTDNESIFITDNRYFHYARQTLIDWTVVLTSGNAIYQSIAKECARLGVVNVGYEEDTILKQQYDSLSSELKDCNLVPFSEFIRDNKAIKNSEMLAYMAEAQRISEVVLAKVIPLIKLGVTEREIAASIDYELIINGAEEPSFDTIVAFGKNSSRPHHRPSYAKFEKGDIILIDMGAKYNGYCSDMTRTFALGEVSKELQTIHDIVVGAQNYALKHIKAGMQCGEVDAMCREYIKANGYEKEFLHSTGHGVGTYIHEYPRVSEGSVDELKDGMVITVEPGVYIEGLGGVRMEDMVVVKRDGVHNLTSFNKKLNINAK